MSDKLNGLIPDLAGYPRWAGCLHLEFDSEKSSLE